MGIRLQVLELGRALKDLIGFWASGIARNGRGSRLTDGVQGLGL